MASSITFATYNMHGFDNGLPALQDLCKKVDIIAVEEHWLASYNMDKLLNLNADFQILGWTAMNDKINSGFLTGRPYGGLGLLARKNLNIQTAVLDIMQNCRAVSLQCTFQGGYKLMLCIVYFPCSNSSVDYECDLLECLGFIEKCASVYEYDNLMVLGDMNFECNAGNRGYKLFQPLCDDLHILHANTKCRSVINYTYFQETTYNQSHIDHIFVSSNLLPDVSRYGVCDDVVNLSDHWPVECCL